MAIAKRWNYMARANENPTKVVYYRSCVVQFPGRTILRDNETMADIIERFTRNKLGR